MQWKIDPGMTCFLLQGQLDGLCDAVYTTQYCGAVSFFNETLWIENGTSKPLIEQSLYAVQAFFVQKSSYYEILIYASDYSMISTALSH